ncbi:MAG: sigma-70 family RNA polymerase sigma factor [Muribaculaceae bacterium]|jgi:RNA polymerase sigma factor, sigma-70 family|nr:sigma-70 family RNA polymerase sigma factor [Muribaculaceae bacterium]
MNDIELWKLVLKGDSSALSMLYCRYYELMLNFGLKYSPDVDLVKDCIQDVFVKICSSRRLSDLSYVKSYLLASMRNVLIDRMSALKAEENIEEYGFCLDVDDTALERLFRHDDDKLRLSRRLLYAYRMLPKNQREVLYLRYVKGLSHKEVAAVLEINPQSSMNQVYRALERLRAMLGADFTKCIALFFLQGSEVLNGCL